MDRRRRIARRAAGWMAFCQVEGDHPDRQRECRILDISEYGVGLHLRFHQAGNDDLVGRHIAVESPTMGAAVTIRLEGTVRYVVSTDDDLLRLGIEFSGLTELEQTVVRALGALSPAG